MLSNLWSRWFGFKVSCYCTDIQSVCTIDQADAPSPCLYMHSLMQSYAVATVRRHRFHSCKRPSGKKRDQSGEGELHWLATGCWVCDRQS